MNRAKILGWLKRRRVAVLKGGWSRERSISLKTGAAIEASLRRLGIPAFGLDVRPTVLDDLKRRRVSFAFIALHGAFGEDGRIQACLDLLGIPYTGCGAAASAIAMDKVASKKLFEAAGVPTPPWRLVERAAFRREPRQTVAALSRWAKKRPLFVKPFDQGSAIGATRVDRASGLPAALRSALRVSSGALVERFITGQELTVGILGGRVLPVIEIVPEHSFYDFHSKYAAGGSRHLVPAPISPALTRRVQAASLAAFRAVGGEAYGRVDAFLDNAGRVWMLEVNTIPGMTNTSLLPDAARAAGISFDDLVLAIVEESLKVRAKS